MNVDQIARLIEVDRALIQSRVKKGIIGEQLLAKPHFPKMIDVGSGYPKMTMEEICEISGASYFCIFKRLKRGITGKELLLSETPRGCAKQLQQ
jgi:hypothetical protein